MSRRRPLTIILASVILVHLAVLAVVAGWRVLPERKLNPPPRFHHAEASVPQPDGSLLRVREFTVPARLAPPAATPPPQPTQDNQRK